MNLSNPKIVLETRDDGSTDVATLSVHWDGLAEITDKKLVLTEPLFIGFELDRQFVIRGPTGYELAAVTP